LLITTEVFGVFSTNKLSSREEDGTYLELFELVGFLLAGDLTIRNEHDSKGQFYRSGVPG
jgi:hypothetical protein